MSEISTTEYKTWLTALKSKISHSQVRAVTAVNRELITLYWELGKNIVETLKKSSWGDKILENLSKDLQHEFPDIKGLSLRNFQYFRKFYLFYTTDPEIVQQPVAQLEEIQNMVTSIPWGHNIAIFTKSKDLNEALFYLSKTIENGWSRDTLHLQLKSDLYQRQGKAITNFEKTLPRPQSDLARQTLKDPYIFDFLTLSESTKEKDVEDQLVSHVTRFLLELGKGFAFIGRQYHLEVADQDYYLDLLFYHTILKCYVVIELKNTRFIPEYAGKLNFYLSAVDSIVKHYSDNPTIGILLCRDKNNIEVEFALRDIGKPMGVSEFQLSDIVPDDLKSSLPTIEEIEEELRE
jgi:predicted nuclease of restriction endonuclease-like (RecB) superfamily